MAIVKIIGKHYEESTTLQKFEIKCKACGSANCKITIDWAAYPESSWNNTTIICDDCHEEEDCIES